MPPKFKIHTYTNRWQGMMLVLHALHELGGSNPKQEVIDYINRSGYYDITKHDLPPYESQNEPKYHTLLAWARKDCVERDLILGHERDAWALRVLPTFSWVKQWQEKRTFAAREFWGLQRKQ